MSRAKTKEEVRKEFLETISENVSYWYKLSDSEIPMDFDVLKWKLGGLAFSILNIIDGTATSFPSLDLVVRPNPQDKEHLESEGSDWYEDGMVINGDVMLHELIYKFIK